MEVVFSISFLSIITGLFGFIFYALEGGKRYFKTATFATLLSFVCLTIFIIMYGVKYGFNPANYISQPCYILAWLMMAVYFYAEYKYKIRILGSLFIPIVTVFLLIPYLIGLDPEVDSHKTFSNSFFIYLHIILLLTSFTFFFLAFAQAIIYLIKIRALKKHKTRALDEDLPSLGKLERILLKTFNVGWITMTSGLLIAILGALGDKEITFDTKVIMGSALWVVYSFIFALYQIKKITTRNLARAVTVLFIFFMGFFICFSLHSSDSTEKNQQVLKGE